MATPNLKDLWGYRFKLGGTGALMVVLGYVEDLLRVRLCARHQGQFVDITAERVVLCDAVAGAEVEHAPESLSDDAAIVVTDVDASTCSEGDEEREQERSGSMGMRSREPDHAAPYPVVHRRPFWS